MNTESPDKLFGNLPRHGSKLDEENVHHLRKGTKLLRAQLQLLRQLEGQRQETEHLRQAVKELARLLASQRDADVLHQLMEELKAGSDDIEITRLLDDLQHKLSGRRLPPGEMKRVIELAHDIELNTRHLVAHRHSDADITRVLDSRLESLLAAGPALLDSGDWDALHDWRKQVKKLMYQYRMKPSHTPRDRVVLDLLDQLGSDLGKLHDLCILEDFVREQEKEFTRAHTMFTFERLFDLIDARRQEQLARCRIPYDAINNLDRGSP